MNKRIARRNYQDLERLYKSDGRKKNNGRFEKNTISYWRRITMLTFLVLTAASLAAWFGFYVFSSLGDTADGMVTLEIIAPESVEVGAATSYSFIITNNSADPIKDLNLRVNYPDSFVWQSATVTPETFGNNTWTFSNLASGKKKEIVVKGVLFGQLKTLKTIFGVLTYKLDNFNSELQVTDSTSTVLERGSVKLVLSGPRQVSLGELVEYKIEYENTGEESVPALTLSLSLPSSFNVESTDPAVSVEGEWSWPIASLEIEEAGEIVFTGRWEDGSSQEQVLIASLESDSEDGRRAALTSEELNVKIISGEIMLRMIINDSADIKPVALGDTVRYTLEYENTSDESIMDVGLVVKYETSLIEWGSVGLNDGGEVEGTTLKWSGKNTPALARVLPGSKGQLSWELPLVSILPRGGRLSVTATPFLSYRTEGDTLTEKIIEGQSMTVPLNTDIKLIVKARYFSDRNTPVGSGPLPPRVGEATTYQIIWKVQGTVHPLRDIRVMASLPQGLKVAPGSATTGSVNINNGSPEWLISSLAPGLEPQASYFVTLTPGQDDVGKLLVLSGQTSLVGIDQNTNGEVRAIGNVATTNLDADPVAKGQGVIIE